MTIPSKVKPSDDDIEDPVDRMLKKTGCMELHYQVQECIAETQDWRKCQEQVQKFKDCMAIYQQKQQIVRSDIPMTKGKMGAQCAHAALECYRRASSRASTKPILNAWLSVGQPKIVVRIQGERNLLTLAKDATDAGLVTAIIKDAGRTQLRPGTISVLGIGPAPTAAIDPLTSSLKLL